MYLASHSSFLLYVCSVQYGCVFIATTLYLPIATVYEIANDIVHYLPETLKLFFNNAILPIIHHSVLEVFLVAISQLQTLHVTVWSIYSLRLLIHHEVQN